MDEFWNFIVMFEDEAKEMKKKDRKKGKRNKFAPKDMDPTSWIRDPKREHKG